MHKLSADVKSQTAAFFVFGIYASPEAFENMGQVSIGQGAAAVAYGYEDTAILLGKADFNALSVAVFYSILPAGCDFCNIGRGVRFV